MADIGYCLLQTVTSTLCEQCGPVIGEPQAAPTNSHFQFGTHMGGGTLHWQAAGNGGPLTVTFLPASSSSTTPPPPVAQSLSHCHRSKIDLKLLVVRYPYPVHSLAQSLRASCRAKRLSLFPTKAHNLPPLPSLRVPKSPDPKMAPPASASMEQSTVGYGIEALASSSQMRVAVTYSYTDPVFNQRK